MGAFQKEDFILEDIEDDAQELKRILDDIFYARDLKTNEAAERIGIAAERLYKYVNGNSSNNNLPCFLLPAFTKEIGPELLMYLAQKSGFGVYRLPNIDQVPFKDALKAASLAMKECVEAIDCYLAAVDDGVITWKEDKDIHKEIPEGIEGLLFMQAVAERMRREKDVSR